MRETGYSVERDNGGPGHFLVLWLSAVSLRVTILAHCRPLAGGRSLRLETFVGILSSLPVLLLAIVARRCGVRYWSHEWGRRARFHPWFGAGGRLGLRAVWGHLPRSLFTLSTVQ